MRKIPLSNGGEMLVDEGFYEMLSLLELAPGQLGLRPHPVVGGRADKDARAPSGSSSWSRRVG